MEPLLDADAWSALFVAFPATWLAYAAIVGSLMASCAGVVADRLPHSAGWRSSPRPGVSMWARSRCDSCGTPISALGLVPVLGWLLLRGRCSSCGVRVPWRYPAAEAATALVSAAFAWRWGPTAEGVASLVVLWTLVALAWVDWREAWLPDRFTATLVVVGLLVSPFEPDPLSRSVGLAMGLAGMLLSFKLVGWAKGMDLVMGGDLMLCAAAGAWLGPALVPAFLGLSAAFYVAQFALAWVTGFTWKPADDSVIEDLEEAAWMPMGPALCLAFAACLLLGPSLALV